MDIHPLLAAMPTGSERDYEILRDDIDRNGLVEPIKTWKDVVTDGRQRLRACQETGQEVRTAREWGDDEDNVSEEEVVERILQRNLKRAHWTTGQKAAAVLEVALWRHRQAAAARQAAGVRPNLDEGQVQGRAMELAAKQYGVSAASCYMLRQIKEADTATYGEVKAGLRTINSAYRELERRFLVPQRKPSGHQKKPHKPGAYVSIPRAGDDRPGYVIGIGLDTAAWAAQGMLPDPRVVEQRILDLPDEEARAAGEAAVACADYWGAVAQMFQHDARDPVDAPLVVEVTDAPALALPPAPRNLVAEWIDQQQAIAGGEAITVDAMVAAVAAQPDGISTIRMALATVATTLQDVIRALAKL